MILVTHSLQQARRVADEALFFYKGKLMESGAKERLLYHPTQPETKRFLEFYVIAVSLKNSDFCRQRLILLSVLCIL